MIKNKKLFLKVIFGILVVVILIGGFFLIKNLLIVTSPQPSTIEVVYSTHWGPLVANYEITINNEGDMTLIDNLARIESEKTKTAKLSAKELQELKESVIKASVFKFTTDYSCRINCILDGLSRSLEFKIDGKTKKITNYEKSFPDELETIIKKIEDLKCLHLPDKFCPEDIEVTITTDKTEYRQGEIVKVTISKGYKPIYAEYFPMGSKILFYRQKGDGWEKLIPECEINCQWICKNNKLEMGDCIVYEQPLYYYYEYTSPLEIQWNQKECIYKTKPCGNQTYADGSLKQVSPGKFKVEFCYWNEEDIDLIKPQGLAPLEKKKCIGSNFMIK